MLRRLILVLLGTLAGLAMGEVVLRLRAESGASRGWESRIGTAQPPPCRSGREATLGELIRRSEIPDLIYELKPNIETVYHGARVRTNAESLRAEREYARPKPAGIYRILLLGDSQTFGQGVELKSTFGALLEEELNRRAGGRRVEVINSGVDGYTTGQEAAFFESKGIHYQPDCVIILFIGNDLELPDFLSEPVDPLSDDRCYLLDELRALRGQPRAERQQRRLPRPYRHLVGPQGYKGALRRIAKAASENSVTVVNFLGGEARLAAVQDRQFWREVELLQDELRIVCPTFEYPWGPEWWISDENRHLSAFGHRVLLERMLEGLEEKQVPLPGLEARAAIRPGQGAVPTEAGGGR